MASRWPKLVPRWPRNVPKRAPRYLDIATFPSDWWWYRHQYLCCPSLMSVLALMSAWVL